MYCKYQNQIGIIYSDREINGRVKGKKKYLNVQPEGKKCR